METFKLGSWIQDTEDKTNHPCFEKTAKLVLLENTSNKCDLRNWCSAVENQGFLSSCVANSIVGGLELLRIKQGLQHTDLSRLFLYYNSRAQHSSELKDDGTYIRVCIKTLQTLGTCKETSWPYDTNKVLVRPSWMALREAYNHKISTFSRIWSEGQERTSAIKMALRSGYPVVFGMLVDKKFTENTNGIIKFDESFVSLGSHAMLIVGFDEASKQFIIRNSWGTGWGDDGYCLLKYEYLTLCDANDFWVLEGI